MPVTVLVTPGPEVTSATPTRLRRTRIGIGRMNRCLLVTDQHVLDLILLEERVVNVQNGPARVTENTLHLFFLQAPDYNFRTADHHS
jgi:hypothetical protein